jgi:hypothetical protein
MTVMLEQRAKDPAAFIGGGDAVHPGPPGHTIMAWAILKGLGATSLVSQAEINVGQKKVAAKRCQITNVKFADGVLGFDRADESLPMPIDARAEPALKIAPILEDLNRYELKVMGLQGDSYDVTIDGEAAATVTKDELAKGWNMALAKGPIAKQAQDVLQLIFKKNDVFFDRWRNVQLNPARQTELAKFDQQVAELETQIDAARKPKPHHFELKPVAK